MGFTYSRSRLLLIVAAFFLAIAFLAYHKLGEKTEVLSEKHHSENSLAYTRPPHKVVEPDADRPGSLIKGRNKILTLLSFAF